LNKKIQFLEYMEARRKREAQESDSDQGSEQESDQES
jgi:hypothetical protein